MGYLSDEQVKAIGEMALLNRGRLSVQPVTKTAYDAVIALSRNGGWESWPGKWNPAAPKATKKTATPSAGTKKEEDSDVKRLSTKTANSNTAAKAPVPKKAKVETAVPSLPSSDGLRRSSRRRSGT